MRYLSCFFVFKSTVFHICNLTEGIHLEDGIESVQDLIDLGLDKLTAKVLLKRITVWKEEGLPENFRLNPHVSTPIGEFTGSVEIQLDDNFVGARYCKCQAATDSITAAAEAGNYLAQSYLSILYDREGTLVEKNRLKAEEYTTKALTWLKENAANGNIYASST